jgi:hypothetical protein
MALSGIECAALAARVKPRRLIAPMPFLRKSDRPALDRCDGHCAVCDQTAVTVVAEFSTSVFFRCETCGFLWMEQKAETSDMPKQRVDD